MNNCKQQNDNNLPYRFQISINEKYNKTCMEFLIGLGEEYRNIFPQLRVVNYISQLYVIKTLKYIYIYFFFAQIFINLLISIKFNDLSLVIN